MTTGVLEHDALFFRGDEAFVSSLVPWLDEGLEAGDPIVVASTRDHVELLQDALGPSSHRVSFFDSADWYRRPAPTIAAWHRALRMAESGGVSVRAVGEVRFGEAHEDHAAWNRYESILNHVFAAERAWIVCPYDEDRLPTAVLDEAKRTHPTLWNGDRMPSDQFLPPAEYLTTVAEPSRPLPDAAEIIPVGEDLAGSRRTVRAALKRANWPESRVYDVELAFSEIASNAVRHGGGLTRAAVHVTAQEVICEVRDRGGSRLDQLAGFMPPREDQAGGIGLWLVRQLCSWLVVEVDGDASTVVRFGLNRHP